MSYTIYNLTVSLSNDTVNPLEVKSVEYIITTNTGDRVKFSDLDDDHQDAIINNLRIEIARLRAELIIKNNNDGKVLEYNG